MSSEQLSCAQRIDERLAGREEDMFNIFNALDNDEEYEGQDAHDAMHEYALGYDKIEMLKIQLSTGGPGDWLECYLSDNALYKVEYHFNDWFDHAQVNVDDDSSLFRYAETVVEGMYFS